jgi:hypothetical protein
VHGGGVYGGGLRWALPLFLWALTSVHSADVSPLGCNTGSAFGSRFNASMFFRFLDSFSDTLAHCVTPVAVELFSKHNGFYQEALIGPFT